MPKLALVRHGQSQWNLENRFTGWWDADLTAKGEAEAKRAGELLKEAGFEPKRGFTSVQTRAIRTLWLALTEMGRVWLPVEKSWRLNERHYGGLTGLDKEETAEKHGEDQVHIWRRSYDVPPPPMEAGSDYDMSKDPRYDGIDIPATESLKHADIVLRCHCRGYLHDTHTTFISLVSFIGAAIELQKGHDHVRRLKYIEQLHEQLGHFGRISDKF